MTRFIFEEMANADDDEVFVEDMNEYPGYAIHSNGTVQNTLTGKFLKPSVDGNGYYFIGIKNTAGETKNARINVLMGKYFLKNPENKPIVDHIDRNRLNNNLNNLRWATYSENNMNKGLQTNNTSGYPGVRWHARDKKWVAQIKIDKHQLHLGYFDSIQQAVNTRNAKARELFGTFYADI